MGDAEQLTPDQPVRSQSRLYVHIVESLFSRENRQAGRLALRLSKKISSVKHNISLVESPSELGESLYQLPNSAHGAEADRVFFHLIAHGWQQSLDLASGIRIGWYGLGEALKLLNGRLNGKLSVGMSSCEGLFAAFRAGASTAPYQWLVGSESSVTGADTTLAFAALYNRLNTAALSCAEAQLLIQTESSNASFRVYEGSAVKTIMAGSDYEDFMKFFHEEP